MHGPLEPEHEGVAVDEKLLGDLLKQAWLFEDPKAYEAGVRDAWAAVASHVEPGAETSVA